MISIGTLLQAAPTTQDVVGVAKGISDFGMMAIAAAFFIVLAAALMWSCFAWFKTLINGMIETQKKSIQDLLAETRAQNAAFTDIAEEWVEQVANVVESEIYHVDGENNSRAFSNVSLAYDNIKTEFYAKMKD